MLVMFVCTGNTCRSPMAEALASHIFGGPKDVPHIFISRGISVARQGGAEPNAALALKQLYGVNLTGHVARQLAEEDAAAADIVLTMTGGHKAYLANVYPDMRAKLLTLSEFSDERVGDVPDPFGGGIVVYKKCAKTIHRCIKKLILQ